MRVRPPAFYYRTLRDRTDLTVTIKREDLFQERLPLWEQVVNAIGKLFAENGGKPVLSEELAKELGMTADRARHLANLSRTYKGIIQRSGFGWAPTDEVAEPLRVIPKRKLADDDVRVIRASKDSCSTLAKRYGVSIMTISNVKNRKSYADVPNMPEKPAKPSRGTPKPSTKGKRQARTA
jgi:hypothetical protein